MSFKKYKEESRKDWGSEKEEALTVDQINTGAILRIADATEAMAKNHVQLLSDRDWYKKMYEQYKDRCITLERSNRSLRGVITKLKKK